jgi:hypothetical protein
LEEESEAFVSTAPAALAKIRLPENQIRKIRRKHGYTLARAVYPQRR